MPSTDAIDLRLLHLGLLIIRVVFGLIFAAHGAQKLFGWFSGYGLTGTGEFMVQLGFTPGRAFATAAALSEFLGGLLLAVGLLGPVGPALMLSVMTVAMITVHRKNKFFVTTNGIEHPLMFATAAIALALTGPGRYSLDYAFGLQQMETPAITWIVLAVGLIGGLLNVALRRTTPKVA